MSNKFTGETVRELCLIIAPRVNGVEDGSTAKDTGIKGAAEKTGISKNILQGVINYRYSIAYKDAEILIQTAFPDDSEKQNEYRNMEGYPAKPVLLALTEIAKESGIENVPPLTDFFDTGLRLKNKSRAHITRTINAKDILNGRAECDVVQANSLLQEIGFKNGLDIDFVEQAYETPIMG